MISIESKASPGSEQNAENSSSSDDDDEVESQQIAIMQVGDLKHSSIEGEVCLSLRDIHKIEQASSLVKGERYSPGAFAAAENFNLHRDDDLGTPSTLDTTSTSNGCVSVGSGHQRAGTKHQSVSGAKDYEEVKQVDLFGSNIVALTIGGRERLCLAQISNTLLKSFSYNEIHNRRVALGITCVQCTPIQLEMLRRAGAMPSSSRRCGMITRREAERLCRSFLVEEQPPELPENFYFAVAHRVNYGCKGRFVPARYISSRAKCIECFYCGEYYSPNKFIFHSHKQPHVTDCNPPDSPNINSWRKHIDLDWTQEHGQDVRYAWEDVKSLFNGGTRRRATASTAVAPGCAPNSAAVSASTRTGGSAANNSNDSKRSSIPTNRLEEDQLIDVEYDDQQTNLSDDARLDLSNQKRASSRFAPPNLWTNQQQNQRSSTSSSTHQASLQPGKRPHSGSSGGHVSKRGGGIVSHKIQRLCQPDNQSPSNLINAAQSSMPEPNLRPIVPPVSLVQTAQSLLVDGLLNHESRRHAAMTPLQGGLKNPINLPAEPLGLNYSTSAAPSSVVAPNNFIYNQLYAQLMQPQRVQDQQINPTFDAQLALRHHLWSSLLANLQCGQQSGNDTYNLQRQQHQTDLVAMQQQCNQSNHKNIDLESAISISHLTGQIGHSSHQANNSHITPQGHNPDNLSSRFHMHDFSPAETNNS